MSKKKPTTATDLTQALKLDRMNRQAIRLGITGKTVGEILMDVLERLERLETLTSLRAQALGLSASEQSPSTTIPWSAVDEPHSFDCEPLQVDEGETPSGRSV